MAPPLIASSAAALAPSGVPLSSLTMSCRLGLSRSNRASSPACLRLLPMTPAWPCADSGTSSATLIWLLLFGRRRLGGRGTGRVRRQGIGPVRRAGRDTSIRTAARPPADSWPAAQQVPCSARHRSPGPCKHSAVAYPADAGRAREMRRRRRISAGASTRRWPITGRNGASMAEASVARRSGACRIRTAWRGRSRRRGPARAPGGAAAARPLRGRHAHRQPRRHHALRALAVLARADVIYCEDTRHSRTLLAHYSASRGPRAPITSTMPSASARACWPSWRQASPSPSSAMPARR